MNEAMHWMTLFGVSFILSLGAGYLVTMFRQKNKRHFVNQVELNAPVRLRAASGVYRTRLLERSTEYLEFSAPIQRGHFVPLRVGDELIVEAPVDHGVVVFEVTVTQRCSESKSFRTTKPEAPTTVNRRVDHRTRLMEGVTASLNADSAKIIDISTSGGRFSSLSRFEPGEVVKLKIDSIHANLLAWVLECVPTSLQDRQGYMVRLRFTEKLPTIPIPEK